MKHFVKRSLSLLFILFGTLLASHVFAQSPQGINYQAVAHGSDGSVLENQTVDVQLGIISGTANGNLEYEEIHSVTTNEYGLFSLQIGTATQTGGSAASFSAINWGTNSHFLNVQVNAGSGYEDIGTMQFMSVPYALYAESAGSSGSITGGTGIDVTGGVVTNTGDTDASDDITNTTTAGGDLSGTYPDPLVDKLQGTPVSGNAPVANQVLLFDGSEWVPATPAGTDGDWVINGTDIYTNLGGNVGIGTATPGAPLHIETSSPFPLVMSSDNPTATTTIIESTTPGAVPATLYVNGNDTMAMGLDPTNNMFFVIHNMPSGVFFMQSDSFVVASDNPQGTKFFIDGMMGADSVIAGSGLALFNGAGNIGYVLADDGTGNAVWTDPQSLFGGSDKIADGDADTYIVSELNPDDDILRFGTDGSERMRIAPTGAVGIGTTTPTNALEVVTTDTVAAKFSGSNAVASAIVIESTNPTALSAIVLKTTAADSAFIGLNPNNEDLFIENQINGGKLSVRADTISIGANGNGGFTVVDGRLNTDTIQVNSELSLLNGSGNTGHVLADDGSGNAVWTDPNTLVTPTTQNINSVLATGGDGGNQPIVNVSSIAVGSNTASSTVDVTGDVSATNGYSAPGTSGYHYSTPKAKKKSVGPASFQSANPQNYGTGGIGVLKYMWITGGGSGSAWAAAPLDLPDGAVITQFQAFVYDNDAAQSLIVSIHSNPNDGGIGSVVGSVSTTAAGASTSVQTLTSTPNLTVDLDNNYYSISFETQQNNQNLRMYNVLVTYTIVEE